MYIFIALLFLLSKLSLEAVLWCFDGDPSYDECFCTYDQDARIGFGYTTGKFISIQESYGEFGIFKPLSLSEDFRPFIDLKGYVFNDGLWAANGGLGYREAAFQKSVFGINVYYDYRRGESKNSFNQIGLGLEWLNDCFDIIINGYFPVGKQFNRAKSKRAEYAYTGFDAALGTTLLSYCGYNFYGLAGTYSFSRRHKTGFWGTFATLELDWKTLITLKVRFSSDRIYSKNIQGIIQFSIPLDLFYCSSCNECYSCWDLMSQPVRRIGIILLEKK